MEARQFSAERGNILSEGAEPFSPSFIPCTVNISAPVSVVSTPVVVAVPNGTENVSGLRSRQRTSGIFTWDHQAILFLIEAKRLEWEDFEATTGRRGVMITAAEKWRKVQERLASNGVVADVSQIRSK
ncbi:hypothetical protein R1sor_011149 [Riccia sorocarpa]|uniref:Uncharacterized protein n=1 Tax=Riccia sorocarpa TaxID=122646 RepID=A0ABD3I0E4_9MARC